MDLPRLEITESQRQAAYILLDAVDSLEWDEYDRDPELWHGNPPPTDAEIAEMALANLKWLNQPRRANPEDMTVGAMAAMQALLMTFREVHPRSAHLLIRVARYSLGT